MPVDRVTVIPEQFTLVSFDPVRIKVLVDDAAERVGLPVDLPIAIEVDETNPLGRTRVESVEPLRISALSGAFEDAKRPRHLSDRAVQDVVGRLLFRVSDRLNPQFGQPPADSELTLQQRTAWDTYSVGRCERVGLPVQRQRRLYHFRNRHGFTDVADTVFDRLWASEGLTWADIEAACAETEAGKSAASL